MRRRTPAVFAALTSMVASTTVIAGLSATSADAAATDQSYWVPVDKQVVVRGHGYGHGHGMSQYGAQGAALEGKTYKEIVDFYYPGTSWDKVRGQVRVLITADTTTDLVVRPIDGLTLRDRGDAATYELPEVHGVTHWRLDVRDGETVVGYLTDRWRRYKPGGKSSLVGDGEFFAPAPITLLTPSGSHDYRGILRAASPSPNSTARDTVNVLSMDRYVMGVVPYEMPASWHPEAVRAQAIAARTYATWSRNQSRGRYYQICDTTACQVYGGASGEDARSNQAVQDTARQILTYAGQPAFTQFSSSSGGWTSAGSVSYLPAQKDPFDGWEGNPVHSWSTTIDAGQFERTYPSLGRLTRIQVVSRDGHGAWAGRVNNVVLDGSRNDVTISGDTFRWIFGLRSTWFSIDPTPIISRWTRIGGTSSRLGGVESREYRVTNGAAQTFDRGRIYYSPRTGARELYGAILATYRRLGGPGSDLGLPRTAIQERVVGYRAKFQGGLIYSKRATGTVPVLGRIAKRYLRFGGAASELGWPTVTNFATPGGERADFEHGYIEYHAETSTTSVRVSD